MHRPIFIITSDKECDFEQYMNDNLLECGSHDWYQGLKESKRWPEYDYFDKVRKLSNPKVKDLLTYMIKQTDQEIQTWLEKGQKELKEGKEELSWILSSFSIASGKTVNHVFDNTGWSNEGIVSEQGLADVIKNSKGETLYMRGFDVHY